ncbi:MAG TPA: TIGR02391 family protein [Candidatus Dormibacteraeota bacterium]|nr:TIGR02391 family protein [Candidatus Dormibacteraeota bacterium]
MLIAMSQGADSQMLHPHNVLNPPNWAGHDMGENPMAFLKAISEAWSWLVSEGLVARKPNQSGESCFVTRRGGRLAAATDPLRDMAAEDRLAAGLHPRIEQRIRQQFLLGEFELAAFAAMKEVEIRVREIGGFPDSEIGVRLMQAAFNDSGPLTDPNLDPGEQTSTRALFWGAIGVFKNPSSHRQVRFEDSTEAAEVVLFADLLLRLLDRTEARLKHP